MHTLVSNGLLLVIAGGVGYLVGQGRPEWFGPELRQRAATLGWIMALLLVASLRAAARVYGPGSMFAILSVTGGFALGLWLALRPARRRPG